MGAIFLVVDASHVVHTSENLVDHNLWVVHQENVQLLLIFLKKNIYFVDCGGGVCRGECLSSMGLRRLVVYLVIGCFDGFQFP